MNKNKKLKEILYDRQNIKNYNSNTWNNTYSFAHVYCNIKFDICYNMDVSKYNINKNK